MNDKMDKWVEKARTAIKWVAVDEDGTIYGYTEEPAPVGEAWCGESGGCQAIYLGFLGTLGTTRDKELIKNWKNTLTEVKYGD